MEGKKPRTLQEAIGLTLDRRRHSQWPVSVASTVESVRRALPACDLTNSELSDMIVIASLERGLGITFDQDLIDREAS